MLIRGRGTEPAAGLGARIRGCGTEDAAGGSLLLLLALGRAVYLGRVSLIVLLEGFFGGAWGGAGVGSFGVFLRLPILTA